MRSINSNFDCIIHKIQSFENIQLKLQQSATSRINIFAIQWSGRGRERDRERERGRTPCMYPASGEYRGSRYQSALSACSHWGGRQARLRSRATRRTWVHMYDRVARALHERPRSLLFPCYFIIITVSLKFVI